MILYTIMPQELIYKTPDSEFEKQKVVDVNGVSMIVAENSLKEYQIVRVLSTNPNDFLKEQFTPGSKIHLH